jgi:hypothetical protein
MKVQKFIQYNEARMFDDHNELLTHVDKYLDNVYINRPTTWNKKLQSIIEKESSHRGTGYSINSLVEEVLKDKKILEDFLQDIKSHIKELDTIYQKSEILSDADDKSYEELEKLSDRVDTYLEFIDQYIEDLESLARSYLNIDDKLAYLMRFDFKNFI